MKSTEEKRSVKKKRTKEKIGEQNEEKGNITYIKPFL